MNIRYDTIKLLEENIGKHSDINHRNTFSDQSPNNPTVIYYYPHFVEEENRTQQGQIPCPRLPTDEVLNFVNKKWLPYANRQIKKTAA